MVTLSSAIFGKKSITGVFQSEPFDLSYQTKFKM